MMPDIYKPSAADSTASSLPFKPVGKVIAITSGKGGVGKTFLSANLAAALTKRGHRVLVLDADLGLANLDIVLNLYSKTTLHDVFAGRASVEQAIVQTSSGFSVLLAGSGMVEYSRLTAEVRDDFLRIMAGLVPQYDVVLLDSGAGISDVVLYAVSLASEVIVLATPEPTSLTDAYATVKVLAGQQRRSVIRLVVNQTARQGDGRAITAQLQQVLHRFVGIDIGTEVRLIHTGDIPTDPAVRQTIMRRQLLMQSAPTSPAALAIVQLAVRLEESVLPRAR